jgi:hypothetical protein
MFPGIHDGQFNDKHRKLYEEGMAMLDRSCGLPLL